MMLAERLGAKSSPSLHGEGEDLYMRLKCAQRQAEMLDIQVRAH